MSVAENAPTYPTGSLATTIVTTIAILVALMAAISYSFILSLDVKHYVIPVRYLQTAIGNDKDRLESSALLLVATERKDWEQRYSDAATGLKAKLAEVDKIVRSNSAKQSVATLINASERLRSLETSAITMARDGNRADAIEVFYGNTYDSNRKAFAQGLVNFNDDIVKERTIKVNRQEQSIIVALLMVLLGMVILPVTWLRLIRAQRAWRALLEVNARHSRDSKEELIKNNSELSASLSESKNQRKKITLLSKMGGILHSCVTTEEVAKAMEGYCAQLFLGSSGALYRLTSSRDMLEEIANWGGPVKSNKIFTASECWALRLGGAHSKNSGSLMECPHVACAGKEPANYLCIPLVAQNTTLGLFYIEPGAEKGGSPEEDTASILDLANAVSEQVALAISNIELRNSLRKQSVRDQLTGLFNRRYLEATVERELIRATRQSKPFSIISFDVDHFKRFNDNFGHEAGDVVLRNVGRLLQSAFRGHDIVCRMGGEEFLALLPEAEISSAAARAEEVRTRVAALELDYSGRGLGPITISAGVAEFTRHGETMEDLLKAADVALYQAKCTGRNRVEIAAEKSLSAILG